MIRTYRSGDEIGINKLYKAVFGKSRTLAEWQWKFELFSIEKPIIVVAELDGQIVGHAACLKIAGAFNDQHVLMGERVDIMVHPSYQKKGIYKNIVNFMIDECRIQKIDVLYGFPAETAKEIFLRTADGRDLGNIPRFLAIQRPGAIISSKLAKLSKLAGLLDRPYKLLINRKSSYQMKEIQEHQLDKVDELYHRYSKNYPLHAVKDGDYVRKRYFLHPTRNYKVYQLVRNDEAVGYVVLHEEQKQNGLVVSTIVDLWAENSATVLTEIFRTLRNANEAAMINCWAVPNSPRFTALKRAGFRHVNSPMPFVIKVFNDHLTVSEVNHWHLSQSDVDSY